MLSYVFFTVYLDEVVLGVNRLLTFNTEISKFKVNSILSGHFLMINQ
jgi:hypothetical protein